MNQTIKGTKELVFFFRDYAGLPLDKLIKDLIDVSNGYKEPITVRDGTVLRTYLTIDTEREETDDEYNRRKEREAAQETEDYKVYLRLKERFDK